MEQIVLAEIPGEDLSVLGDVNGNISVIYNDVLASMPKVTPPTLQVIYLPKSFRFIRVDYDDGSRFLKIAEILIPRGVLAQRWVFRAGYSGTNSRIWAVAGDVEDTQ